MVTVLISSQKKKSVKLHNEEKSYFLILFNDPMYNADGL